MKKLRLLLIIIQRKVEMHRLLQIKAIRKWYRFMRKVKSAEIVLRLLRPRITKARIEKWRKYVIYMRRVKAAIKIQRWWRKMQFRLLKSHISNRGVTIGKFDTEENGVMLRFVLRKFKKERLFYIIYIFNTLNMKCLDDLYTV
jgi:hypothetical protein